ncbi:MAG: SDR family oxidoreductase [Armatimonadetes bacterium]|nr:SDR family oxidoreductase [Armatimonadota bacterium]
MHVKRVLVTGSSRGIGRAIALKLSQSGWQVAIHGTEVGTELQMTRDLLGGACAGVYATDLNHPGSADALIDRALDAGPLHALVNNAGVYQPLSFTESSDREFEDAFQSMFRVNFESPLRLTRRISRYFGANEGGKVLNVASRVGFRGEPGAALYAASKAALINLTRSLAVELAPKGIGIFGIAPGWVDTAMVRDGMEERLPTILESIPLGRMASPEDCAHTAAFLLGDEAAYLSGVVIDINGASYFH